MGEASNRGSHLERVAAARAAADPDARELIDAMKDQLILVLVARLGGSLRIPVAEIDNTGGLILSLCVDGSDFVFELGRKH